MSPLRQTKIEIPVKQQWLKSQRPGRGAMAAAKCAPNALAPWDEVQSRGGAWD